MAHTEQTDGTITLKNGQTREAVRYTYADGHTEIMYLTTGLNRCLVGATPATADTFVSNAQAAARRDEDDAFERVAAEADEWTDAFGWDESFRH